jgi:putative DNA primase/helicase
MNETQRHPMDVIREQAKAKHKKAKGKPAFVNGEAVQVRVIDTKAPFATAKLFLENYASGGARTLNHHRGAFYAWNGRAYLERADGELRSEIYPFLDQSFSADSKGNLSSVKPNTAMVMNVLDGLRAAAHLGGKIAAPAWLRPNSNPPAEEVVACLNGLLHLPSGRVIRNTPEFFTYNALDFKFTPAAPEPKQWVGFLHELWPDDPESISTLQEIFGLCLTGDTRQQKAFLLVGPRRSGKGTIARILARLIGADNTVAPTLAGIGTNFGLAPLIGKRVAIISDARLGGRADQHAIAERILSITGEDAITIDRKYAPAWTGQLQTRFIFISNELPRLADASGALASRFIVLLLANSFYGREDHALTDKLFDGAARYSELGDHRLAPPRKIRPLQATRLGTRRRRTTRRPWKPYQSLCPRMLRHRTGLHHFTRSIVRNLARLVLNPRPRPSGNKANLRPRPSCRVPRDQDDSAARTREQMPPLSGNCLK